MDAPNTPDEGSNNKPSVLDIQGFFTKNVFNRCSMMRSCLIPYKTASPK